MTHIGGGENDGRLPKELGRKDARVDPDVGRESAGLGSGLAMKDTGFPLRRRMKEGTLDPGPWRFPLKLRQSRVWRSSKRSLESPHTSVRAASASVLRGCPRSDFGPWSRVEQKNLGLPQTREVRRGTQTRIGGGTGLHQDGERRRSPPRGKDGQSEEGRYG